MTSWTDQDFDPSALIGALADGGVDFVVIGGLAVVLRAMPRFTKDLDICYSSDRRNLDALGGVLVGLEARLRGAEDVPFVPDARSLRRTQILCLTTPKGNIDLLARPDGSPDYETLRQRAETMNLAGSQVRIASIQDLIEMKRAAGRPQDLVDVESLEAAEEQMRS
ncbi:MAG: nucleotidyl transferase AbiEii/AbiGii toxin family protein [Solirubrobacteraceae bacterium]